MKEERGGQAETARIAWGQAKREGVGFAAVVPNPRLKLLDQVREVMRLQGA